MKKCLFIAFLFSIFSLHSMDTVGAKDVEKVIEEKLQGAFYFAIEKADEKIFGPYESIPLNPSDFCAKSIEMAQKIQNFVRGAEKTLLDRGMHPAINQYIIDYANEMIGDIADIAKEPLKARTTFLVLLHKKQLRDLGGKR